MIIEFWCIDPKHKHAASNEPAQQKKVQQPIEGIRVHCLRPGVSPFPILPAVIKASEDFRQPHNPADDQVDWDEILRGTVVGIDGTNDDHQQWYKAEQSQ